MNIRITLLFLGKHIYASEAELKFEIYELYICHQIHIQFLVIKFTIKYLIDFLMQIYKRSKQELLDSSKPELNIVVPPLSSA